MKKTELSEIYEESFSRFHGLMTLTPFLTFLWFFSFNSSDYFLFESVTCGLFSTVSIITMGLHLGAVFLGYHLSKKIKDIHSFNRTGNLMVVVYSLSTIPAIVIAMFPSLLRVIASFLF